MTGVGWNTAVVECGVCEGVSQQEYLLYLLLDHIVVISHRQSQSRAGQVAMERESPGRWDWTWPWEEAVSR